MKFDHYDMASEMTRRYIIRAQQVLFGKILKGLTFASALEIGPGFGGFAEFCSGKNITYKGVEANTQLAERLKARGHDIVIQSAEAFAPPAGQFDLLFAAHVIEHLGCYETVSRTLKQLCKGVSSRGHVVLLFPDVRWSPSQFYTDPTHVYPTSLCSVNRMLNDLSMPVVRSGHYVGRWLGCWKALWLLHRMMPTWLLPDDIGGRIDPMWSAHGFVVARPGRDAETDVKTACPDGR